MLTLNKKIQFLNIIGKGRCGEVYLGRNIITKENYAIKKIPKNLINIESNHCYFNNEIKSLKLLNHPNIVKYKGLYEDDTSYYICTEYCNGGSLESAKKNYYNKYNKPLSEKIVKYFVWNILNGLVCMNDYNIIHRDIKGENILLHYEDDKDLITNNYLKAKVKIIDFGFSRFLKNNELAKSIIGSPLYMDPSILTTFIMKRENIEDGFYDKKVDIWSLGILTYKLLLGNIPFKGDNLTELIDFINNKDFILPMKDGEINQNIILSEDAILFIDKIISTDKNSRPTANKLINDKWFKNDDQYNKKYYCLRSYDEINLLRSKKKFIYFWKIIYKKSKNKSKRKSMSKKSKKKSTQKIINIIRLKPIEKNTLLPNKSQNKSYFKSVKNDKKIIKIENFLTKYGKQSYSRSIELKKKRTIPIVTKKRIIRQRICRKNKYNMLLESYIPRITNYKTIKKSGYFSLNKIKGNISDIKNNENEKKNVLKNIYSSTQFSYVSKKRNDSERNSQLKTNRNKQYSYYIPHIKKRFKSKTKRVSIIDKNDDFTYNYQVKDIYKSI